MRPLLTSNKCLVGLKGISMSEFVSRRKLLLLAGLGVGIAVPATAVLMASDAKAQQADQAAPADAAPKKTKKKKGSASTTAAPPAKPKAQ
jgi:hypothetical protein